MVAWRPGHRMTLGTHASGVLSDGGCHYFGSELITSATTFQFPFNFFQTRT
jgi:hypothetical protein